jgi:hypothetical protein
MNERRSIVIDAIAVLLAIAACAADATQPRGVALPQSARVAEQDLVLNGAGVRVMAFFRIYAAALYLPKPAASSAEALSLPGPKRFTMTMLRDATAPQLVDALDEGLRDNHIPAELDRLRPARAALAAIMSSVGGVPTGTTITLDYLPAAGTQVAIDGKAAGAPIAGADFFAALLRIWIGDAPVDRTLKKALLGQAP